MEAYHPLPQPNDIPTREREDAMGAYLMMFAAIGAGLPLPVINLIAAVIYYFISSNKSRFVRFHSHQSLMSQLPTSLLNIGAVFWVIQYAFFDNLKHWDSLVGYLCIVGVPKLLYFIFSYVAEVRARQGRMYYLPFFGHLAYDHAFRIRPGEDGSSEPVNQAPR